MALIEVGRVCVKKYGRDAGSRAVITKLNDKGFVSIVTSIRNKERKCNVKHLEFLSERIDPSNKQQLAQALEIEMEEAKPAKPEKPKAK